MTFLLQLVVICVAMSILGFCMGLAMSLFFCDREVNFRAIRFVLGCIFFSTVVTGAVFFFNGVSALVVFQSTALFLLAWVFCYFFIAVGEGRKWIRPADFVRSVVQG